MNIYTRTALRNAAFHDAGSETTPLASTKSRASMASHTWKKQHLESTAKSLKNHTKASVVSGLADQLCEALASWAFVADNPSSPSNTKHA